MGSSISFAQPTLQWAGSMGGTSWERGLSIAVDGSGNVYTTGEFQGTVDFDPGAGTYNLTSAGARDIFVNKLDVSGNLVWAKIMGSGSNDYGRSIAVDDNGNVYTTGYFVGTSDLDPGAGTYNLISAGIQDVFVSKLDASGNFVWAKRLGGTSNDYGYSIALDGSGNVYTTGNFRGTVDFDPGAGVFNLTSTGFTDIFVSKLDASGNFVWAKNMGGTIGDLAKSITVDAFGNVYTTGYISGTSDLDPGAGIYNLISVGNFDIFVSKLDASGNFVWAKSMGGTSSDWGYSIAVDGSGNVYTTGYFQNTVDFNPGAGIYNLTSAGGYDIFVSKLDASGNFVWAIRMGGTLNDYANSITLDASFLYIMGDQYSAVVDYDPGAGVYNLSNTGTEANFVGKYDMDGNLICAFPVTPGHNETEQNRHIAVDGNGNVYITASFNDPAVDLDPCTPIYNVPFFGSYDIYVAKYDFNACNCSPMPIDLLSFTGYNEGNKNILEWQTASETNNDYFTIEKAPPPESPSPKGEGDFKWQPIGTIAGAGNSNQTLSYSFIDNSPPLGGGDVHWTSSQPSGMQGGASYYRLKQTDYDGRYEYSNIISVKIQSNGDVGAIEIYPNPAEDHFNFSFNAGSSPENLSLTITDAVGLHVQHQRYNKLEGNTIHTVELNGLEKGIYYVLFKSGDWELTHKLVVVK